MIDYKFSPSLGDWRRAKGANIHSCIPQYMEEVVPTRVFKTITPLRDVNN